MRQLTLLNLIAMNWTPNHEHHRRELDDAAELAVDLVMLILQSGAEAGQCGEWRNDRMVSVPQRSQLGS